jgi:hypothetical protein
MLSCLAASNNGWKPAGLPANSARYRRWNSFHLAGSWLNQRRRSPLGARFLHQASIGNASFFIPRGHRRSTRKRAPSSLADGSYTRLIWIIGDHYFANIALRQTKKISMWKFWAIVLTAPRSHSRPSGAVEGSRCEGEGIPCGCDRGDAEYPPR